MGLLNKERVAFLVALVIGLYGLATAFSGEGVSGAVPEVPLPGDEHDVPSIDVVKVSFLDESFNYYWGAEEEAKARNPWEKLKVTTRLSIIDIPMPEPKLDRFTTVVPAPPRAPSQSRMPVIRQSKAPVSIEGIEPEPGAEDDEE